MKSFRMVFWKSLVLTLLAKQHHALLHTAPFVRPSAVASLPGRTLIKADGSALLGGGKTISTHLKLRHYDQRSPRCDGRAPIVLQSSASDSVLHDDGGGEISEAPLSIAMLVGVVSSLVGYLYGKCLKNGFKLLWKTIPSALFDGGGSSGRGLCKLLRQYPAAYIVLVTTLGGGLVATLSTLKFPKNFSAHDYVHILSRGEDSESEIDDKFPQARNHILPVMLLACLTSISGFSLGPEAPMVTVGGLVGVSIARKYLESQKISDKKTSTSIQETLAYAGAGGILTGTMNIPLAGPIFAMEMTGRGAGISHSAAKSWSAAMASCFAALVFVRGGLVPNMGLGGHFTYGAKAAVGALTGREMVLASLGCGVGGAVVGTCFHKTVSFLKSVIWPDKSSPSNKDGKSAAIAKKIAVAFVIGLISMYYPQTMFWGEPSIQCAIDGQCTPFSATPHAIPAIMTQLARVNPNEPFASGMAALQVGMAKFTSIALASAGGFPGGVIFPLLFNGAPFAHALISALRPVLPVASSSLVAPLMVMSFMAATLTSITRTPLSSVLILALTASGATPLSVLLPGVLMASYVSVWVSDQLSSDTFFHYSE